MARRPPHRVERVQIVAIYRDWSRSKAQDSGYPSSQVQIFEVRLWTSEEATDYLTERVRLHLAAEAGQTEPCTPEERWERRARFALMKKGRKTALKLYESFDEAQSAVVKADQYVEKRQGASVRCQSYCRVAQFCQQYARIKAQTLGEEEAR